MWGSRAVVARAALVSYSMEFPDEPSAAARWTRSLAVGTWMGPELPVVRVLTHRGPFAWAAEGADAGQSLRVCRVTVLTTPHKPNPFPRREVGRPARKSKQNVFPPSAGVSAGRLRLRERTDERGGPVLCE